MQRQQIVQARTVHWVHWIIGAMIANCGTFDGQSAVKRSAKLDVVDGDEKTAQVAHRAP